MKLGYNPHLRAMAAFRRRAFARSINDLTAQVLSTIDVDEFNSRFRDGAAFSTPASICESNKFLDLERGVRVAAGRYIGYGLNRLPAGSRVLDLGCGSGFFLLVCRNQGLRPLGLDLDIDPGYNGIISFFGLERIAHRILPENPLPALDGQFDMVTAFLTCFNKLPEGGTWTGQEWEIFLTALRPKVRDGGVVFFQFNRDHKLGATYPASVPESIKRRKDFRSRFFADCLRMEAV